MPHSKEQEEKTHAKPCSWWSSKNIPEIHSFINLILKAKKQLNCKKDIRALEKITSKWSMNSLFSIIIIFHLNQGVVVIH